ncbi:hypothetical protein BY996DRAFT_6513526 [Phakopsora pachyrhizi]|nr:hypothetical protein BY996DRAFT_6513526 [Phakopsora pachyrhizi]
MCTPPSAIEGGMGKFLVGLGVFKIVFRGIDWQVDRRLAGTHKLMGMTHKCGFGQWVQSFVTQPAWVGTLVLRRMALDCDQDLEGGELMKIFELENINGADQRQMEMKDR